MDLKNAAAVCLVSLFSATLVVLIARALDRQAESRLEPQLAAIVGELQAIRQQGGVAASPGSPVPSAAVEDGLLVYYFHSNTRCPTCQAIESQSRDAVQSHFNSQLDRGEIVWKTLNYEQPAAAPLAKKFDVQMPVVVLARMKGGQIQDWRRLDEVWGLVGDRPAFAVYIRDQIREMLNGGQEPAPVASKGKEANVPPPLPANLPIPPGPSGIPVPK